MPLTRRFSAAVPLLGRPRPIMMSRLIVGARHQSALPLTRRFSAAVPLQRLPLTRRFSAAVPLQPVAIVYLQPETI
ncbi:hypothetical protein [Microseira wollei]|uniref:hypothetical protein n=1 Tax=Microseira wollei TaxID=467598 RepID=UPI001CFCFAE4|nr:hypothetical protein [Microseira wollei]